MVLTLSGPLADPQIGNLLTEGYSVLTLFLHLRNSIDLHCVTPVFKLMPVRTELGIYTVSSL